MTLIIKLPIGYPATSIADSGSFEERMLSSCCADMANPMATPACDRRQIPTLFLTVMGDLASVAPI